MPSLRLKQVVLDVQKVFRRRSSSSAYQAPAFEERESSPLAARVSSSESSNAAEKTSQTSFTGQVCSDNHKEEPASNPPPKNTAATALQKETLTRTGSTSSRDGSLDSRARSPTSPSSPSQPTTPLPLPCEEPLASKKLEDRPRPLKDAAEISGSDPPIDPPPPAIIPTPTTTKTSLTASVPPDPANAQLPPSKGKHKPALSDLPPHSPPAPPPIQTSYPRHRPTQVRRQSLLPASETALIQTLLDSNTNNNTTTSPAFNTNSPLLEESSCACFHSVPIEFQLPTPATLGSGMLNRKVWVKRPGGSPTIVNVREDDMVDDVRDMALKKYQNALGRSYDAPDISIKVVPRHPRPCSLDHTPGRGYDSQLGERTLNPDETVIRVLDDYFPGGQSIDEALVIEVPPLPSVGRRTPRPSPHHGFGSHHDGHPGMESNDYFPPMPLTGYSQAPPTSSSQISLREPSIAVLTTGQVPNLPGSPGGTSRRNVRPGARRMQTSSPVVRPSPSEVRTSGDGPGVVLMPRQGRSRVNSDASNTAQPVQAASIPTPTVEDNSQKASTPPARMSSPLSKKFKEKKQHTSPAGLLPDGAVPPINVLIVEDNVINLKLLEAFMKRLKVRWQSAMNGKEAVDKWRAGGFHLVLMDIQLPVMNGLDATKEIRRLERVNSIGAFSQSPSSSSQEDAPAVPDEDKLPNSILFKSPVIIVALTASSLQSDRHEALAAGCNDFLTKPVNFIWLERKVTEWGCMQALIDFDGWRKWKDFTKTENGGGNEGKDRKGFRNQRLITGQKGQNGEPKRLEEKSSLIPPIG